MNNLDKIKCYIPRCKKQVPRTRVMCKDHWFAVPKSIRDSVWENYKARNWREWKVAIDAARAAVGQG